MIVRTRLLTLIAAFVLVSASARAERHCTLLVDVDSGKVTFRLGSTLPNLRN